MRKTIISVVAAALLLSPTPALAGSDVDLCNWASLPSEPEWGVRTRLENGQLWYFGPGYCTQPSQEVLRFLVTDGLSFQIKWRDPVTGYSGTRWVDGPYVVQQKSLKFRILDIQVNEKSDL